MTQHDPVLGPDGHIDVDLLSDLVEGLLDTAAADIAEAHVAACADCRETRYALADIRELLAAQPAEPMPDDVFAGIQAAIAEAARADGRPDTHDAPTAAPASPTATPSAGPSGTRSATPSPPSSPSAAVPSVPPLSPPSTAPSAAPSPSVPPSSPVGSDPVVAERPELDLGSLPPPRLSATPPATPPPQSAPSPAPAPEPAPVVDFTSARARRRRTTGWLLAAAAVAAVFVGVGVSGDFTGGASDNNADGSASAPLTASAPRDAAEGSGGAASPPKAAATPQAPSVAALPEYSRANVTERVDALVERQFAAATGLTGGGSDSAATRPVDVPACVSSVVPDLGTLTAAERARFEGKIAYVLVAAAPDGDSARVAIVDAACAEPRESPNAAAPGNATPGSAAAPPSRSATSGEAPQGTAANPATVLYTATLPLH